MSGEQATVAVQLSMRMSVRTKAGSVDNQVRTAWVSHPVSLVTGEEWDGLGLCTDTSAVEDALLPRLSVREDEQWLEVLCDGMPLGGQEPVRFRLGKKPLDGDRADAAFCPEDCPVAFQVIEVRFEEQ